MEARAVVDAGTCGFVTTVVAVIEEGRSARFTLDSGCEHIAALAAALTQNEPYEAFDEMKWQVESKLRTTVREALKGCYPWCPVPTGLFKAMQLAAGLSLPKDIVIALSVGSAESSASDAP